MGGEEVAGCLSPSSAKSNFRELDDEFLQTQTRIWLGEVLQTRLDEHLNISDLLADGELLLEVSKVVWKMLLANCTEVKHLKAYKAVSCRKSSGRYRPYSNVDSFLKISKIVGLKGIDLFSPSDVVEKRNTRKVCMCIRSLSKKARSKNLDVPDFDIVTYTVAMPTNMVGCIRKSLELSQCRFSSSDSYNQYKDLKMTPRKKASVAAGTQDYDSYSQDSYTESNYMEFQSDSPSLNCASDSTSLISLNLENSQEVSSVIRSYTSAHSEFQLEVRHQDKDECTQHQYESECSDEPMESLCSHCVTEHHLADNISFLSGSDSELNKLRTRSSSHINRRVRHDHQIDVLDLIHVDLYLRNGTSNVGDSTGSSSLDKGHVSPDLAIPDLIDHGIDDDGLAFFDGDDEMVKLETSSDCCGSNSPGLTSVNGFGRIHSDNLEDAEVSSTASLGSVTSRVRQLDFEDQLDKEDDLRTVKVLFPELQRQKADLVNRSCLMGVCNSQDMVRQENMTDSSALECPDQIRDFSDNGKMIIGGIMTESDLHIEVYPNELQTSYFGRTCEDSNASSHIIASQDTENRNKLSHADCGDGFTSSQDERKQENMDVSTVEASDRKEDISTGIPQNKSRKRALLKSVVTGTAVCAVLLLLHLRRRSSKDEAGEPSIRSSRNRKFKGMELSSQKREEGGEVNGVYPAEKLRFKD